MTNPKKLEIEQFNSLFDVIERLGIAFEEMEETRKEILTPNGMVAFASAKAKFEDIYEIFKIYKKNNPF